MTRAEEKAMEAYPVISNGPFTDILLKERNAYINGYIQAEKDTIERACKWLFSNLPIIVDYYFDEGIRNPVDRSEFIKSFRTQMEEEQ